MIGFAVPRQLRTPALALLAMASLVAWGGSTPTRAAWKAPARDGISAVEQLRTAALVSGGPQVGALAESAERPRADGGGSRAGKARPDAPRLVLAVPSRTPDAALSTFLARTRSGRETAPSTGPPSLPF